MSLGKGNRGSVRGTNPDFLFLALPEEGKENHQKGFSVTFEPLKSLTMKEQHAKKQGNP